MKRDNQIKAVCTKIQQLSNLTTVIDNESVTTNLGLKINDNQNWLKNVKEVHTFRRFYFKRKLPAFTMKEYLKEL